ncbi:hypothetical protein FH972_022157 [Carpinus fangiana]|uniref:Uncharacterized protein n=1 Tax=Carpinus fangiana TaxID=176857 RepID=A0A5N6KS23_9ROSI|nr:hypothetical protein FH972_022157 [Carpinus fangiana]
MNLPWGKESEPPKHRYRMARSTLTATRPIGNYSSALPQIHKAARNEKPSQRCRAMEAPSVRAYVRVGLPRGFTEFAVMRCSPNAEMMKTTRTGERSSEASLSSPRGMEESVEGWLRPMIITASSPMRSASNQVYGGCDGASAGGLKTGHSCGFTISPGPSGAGQSVADPQSSWDGQRLRKCPKEQGKGPQMPLLRKLAGDMLAISAPMELAVVQADGKLRRHLPPPTCVPRRPAGARWFSLLGLAMRFGRGRGRRHPFALWPSLAQAVFLAKSRVAWMITHIEFPRAHSNGIAWPAINTRMDNYQCSQLAASHLFGYAPPPPLLPASSSVRSARPHVAVGALFSGRRGDGMISKQHGSGDGGDAIVPYVAGWQRSGLPSLTAGAIRDSRVAHPPQWLLAAVLHGDAAQGAASSMCFRQCRRAGGRGGLWPTQHARTHAPPPPPSTTLRRWQWSGAVPDHRRCRWWFRACVAVDIALKLSRKTHTQRPTRLPQPRAGQHHLRALSQGDVQGHAMAESRQPCHLGSLLAAYELTKQRLKSLRPPRSAVVADYLSLPVRAPPWCPLALWPASCQWSLHRSAFINYWTRLRGCCTDKYNHRVLAPPKKVAPLCTHRDTPPLILRLCGPCYSRPIPGLPCACAVTLSFPCPGHISTPFSPPPVPGPLPPLSHTCSPSSHLPCLVPRVGIPHQHPAAACTTHPTCPTPPTLPPPPPPTIGTPPPRVPAAPSAPAPIPTRIGLRSRTWRSEEEYRIALLNETIKLKKRLEDLERRATSSASPEPKDDHEGMQAQHDQPNYVADASTAHSLHGQGSSYASTYGQQRPRSPSPPSAYTAYPSSYSATAPEYSTYQPAPTYSTYPSLSNDLSAYGSYSGAAQSAARNDRRLSKQETFDEQMRSFNLNYTSPPTSFDQYPQAHRPSWHEAAGPQVNPPSHTLTSPSTGGYPRAGPPPGQYGAPQQQPRRQAPANAGRVLRLPAGAALNSAGGGTAAFFLSLGTTLTAWAKIGLQHTWETGKQKGQICSTAAMQALANAKRPHGDETRIYMYIYHHYHYYYYYHHQDISQSSHQSKDTTLLERATAIEKHQDQTLTFQKAVRSFCLAGLHLPCSRHAHTMRLRHVRLALVLPTGADMRPAGHRITVNPPPLRLVRRPPPSFAGVPSLEHTICPGRRRPRSGPFNPSAVASGLDLARPATRRKDGDHRVRICSQHFVAGSACHVVLASARAQIDYRDAPLGHGGVGGDSGRAASARIQWASSEGIKQALASNGARARESLLILELHIALKDPPRPFGAEAFARNGRRLDVCFTPRRPARK